MLRNCLWNIEPMNTEFIWVRIEIACKMLVVIVIVGSIFLSLYEGVECSIFCPEPVVGKDGRCLVDMKACVINGLFGGVHMLH